MSARNKKLTIIITRPLAQAEAWRMLLKNHGFSVELLPVMAIRSLEDEAHKNAIKSCILNLDHYQKIIFVSQNAVTHGMQWIENYWPQLPMGLNYFAVGATTAQQLMQQGIPVTDLATSASGDMTSEALLKAPELQQVKDEKILIVRGLNGRGHLAQELRLRGARVDYCEVYERYVPETARAQLHNLAARQLQASTHTIISLHSGESAKNLLWLASQIKITLPLIDDWLKRCVFLVPSQAVEQLATDAGFHSLIRAENATDTAMTNALFDYLQENPIE
jgi:uroporphyrinogen-III synthase